MTTDYTGICKLLFDWQTLIAGLLALGAGILAYCAAQRQLRALKSTLQAESMIKLMEKFDSEAYEKKRETAAQACLSNLESRQPGTAVEDVLDFFDDAAFLVKIGALRKDMMWHTLYYWVRLYYQASEQHIISYREKEPTVWENLCWVYPLLNKLEKDKSQGRYKERLDDITLKTQLAEEVSNPANRP